METMYDRIIKMCKARGVTPSGMCVRLGIRKAIMSDLKSGRVETIRTDSLVQFANFLGVSTDYLLTGREFMLKQDEAALLKAWREATLAEKQNVAFALRERGMPMPEAPIEESEQAG